MCQISLGLVRIGQQLRVYDSTGVDILMEANRLNFEKCLRKAIMLS